VQFLATLLVALASCAVFARGSSALVELAEREYTVVARSGNATIPLRVGPSGITITLRTLSVRASDGTQFPAESILFPGTPIRVDRIGQELSAGFIPDVRMLSTASTYQITVEAECRDLGGHLLAQVPLTFRYVVSPLTAQLDGGSSITVPVSRGNPFGQADKVFRFRLATTPTNGHLGDVRVQDSALSAPGRGGSTYIADGAITGGTYAENDKQITVHVSVPVGATKLTGSVRISSPALSSPIEVPVTVLVRDWPVFPLIAILLGYGVSRLITRLNLERRQEALNQFHRTRILQAVNDLFSGQDLVRRDSFQQVLDLIRESDLAHAVRNTVLTRDRLWVAEQTLDHVRNLMNAPPAALSPASFDVSRAGSWHTLHFYDWLLPGPAILQLTAFLVTVIVAFFFVWQKAAFGGPGDYLTSFASATVIDQSVRAIGPALARFRGGFR
jgi:hypothetical protein